MKERTKGSEQSRAMNTRQLSQALTLLPDSTRRGVYASDTIPKGLTRPMALIINTDDHTKPGSHWVCIYCDKEGKGWYFDSYGVPPLLPSVLESLRRNCLVSRWSNRQLQNVTSSVCGQYCLMFLYHMCSGGTVPQFYEFFSKNTSQNDNVVTSFYSKLKKRLDDSVRVRKTSCNTNLRGEGRCIQNCNSRLKNLWINEKFTEIKLRYYSVTWHPISSSLVSKNYLLNPWDRLEFEIHVCKRIGFFVRNPSLAFHIVKTLLCSLTPSRFWFWPIKFGILFACPIDLTVSFQGATLPLTPDV